VSTFLLYCCIETLVGNLLCPFYREVANQGTRGTTTRPPLTRRPARSAHYACGLSTLCLWPACAALAAACGLPHQTRLSRAAGSSPMGAASLQLAPAPPCRAHTYLLWLCFLFNMFCMLLQSTYFAFYAYFSRRLRRSSSAASNSFVSSRTTIRRSCSATCRAPSAASLDCAPADPPTLRAFASESATLLASYTSSAYSCIQRTSILSLSLLLVLPHPSHHPSSLVPPLPS
jgi:hypothetical protein